MRERSWIGSLAGLALLAGPPASAQVVLDQWGTSATIASSDCADFCDPDTDFSWLLGLTFEETNGAAEAPLATASANVARGDAFAEASVLSPLDPVVRVDASSAPGSWMNGTGVAIQGYTYVGLAPDTLALTVELTGTIGNPDGDPATGLAAQVGYVGDAKVSSLLYENAVAGLVTPDGAVQLEQSSDGAVSQSDVLAIPVAPGDQFYVVASSAASAGGSGAFAESLGTLTLTFDPADAGQLVAANAPLAIPVASGPVLGMAALAWLGVARRRLDGRRRAMRSGP